MNTTVFLADTLQQAHDSLTPETWRKGSYFQSENNKLCMCAHGAVQALVNPEVRHRLNTYSNVVVVVVAAASPVPVRSALAAATTVAQSIPKKSSFDIWTNRPDWVRQDYIDDGINYGNQDAHYLLGMVGLTIAFNDYPDTTLETVKVKFSEAIALAKQLGI